MRILRLTATTEKALFKAREGEDREALRVAGRIAEDVRRRGDKAVEMWTRKLDKVDLARTGVWVTPAEFASARKNVGPEFLRAAKHAIDNVRSVAEKQKPGNWTLEVEAGVSVGQVVRPIESIGCYIPGGRFALVSTLVMTVVPAQVAGVQEIVAVCPHPNQELLATADLLGIARLARVGGAQAIAALAYGTRRIPRVEKIFGPGNRFVTAAKQLVSANCAIDLPAGPTEVVVLADRGNPTWIAADILAQAEHAPDAGSYLVTSSRTLAKDVAVEVKRQLAKLPPNNPAHASCRKTSAILIANSPNEAVTFVNRFAPEHLILPDDDARLIDKIYSAGTIFLGPLSAGTFR